MWTVVLNRFWFEMILHLISAIKIPDGEDSPFESTQTVRKSTRALKVLAMISRLSGRQAIRLIFAVLDGAYRALQDSKLLPVRGSGASLNSHANAQAGPLVGGANFPRCFLFAPSVLSLVLGGGGQNTA